MKESIDPIVTHENFQTPHGRIIRLKSKAGIFYVIEQTHYWNGVLEVVSVKTRHQQFKWFERFVPGEQKESVLPIEIMVANA